MVLCQHMAIYGFMSTYGSMKTHKGQNRMTLTLGSQRFTHSAGKSGGAQVQDGAMPGLRICL